MKIEARFSEKRFLGNPQHALVRPVGKDVASVLVLDENDARQVVQDGAKEVSLMLERLLGLLALGDVMRNAEQRFFAAPLAVHDLCLHQNAGPVPGLQRDGANCDFTGNQAG